MLKKPLFFVPDGCYYSRLLYMCDRLGVSNIFTICSRFDEMEAKTPFYLPVPVKSLDYLDQPEKLFLPAIEECLDKPNGYIFFDMSIEAITFNDFSERKLLGFHRILEERKFDPARITLLNANVKSTEKYLSWARKNNIKQPVTMIGYNFYFFEYFWELFFKGWLKQSHRKLHEISYDTVKNDHLRSKYYMCLNLRPRSHRTAIALHLLERGHLDKGQVSYFGEDFGSKDVESVATIEETKKFISTLPSADRLITKWNDLQAISPISFERDSGTMRQDLWGRNSGEIDFIVPEAKQDPPLSKIDTYFEIVTETWFTDENTVYITEKTLRAILRYQPFIHVGSPNQLQNLKDMGFKSFSPWINESYDSINNPAERMEAIFKEIDRLCAMPISDLHKIYKELWPVLEHNFNNYAMNIRNVCRQKLEQHVIKNMNSANIGITTSCTATIIENLRMFSENILRRLLNKRIVINAAQPYRVPAVVGMEEE